MSGGSSRRRAGPSWHSTLSRFFLRSPPCEEGTALSSENKGNEAINLKSNQKESTTLPALLKACPKEEKNHSTEELSKSEIQEELKKANSLPSLTPGVKTADKDKQPREGFFHFLGSLFNIATKSSLVEAKSSTFQDEPSRCEKDLQNTNTLPKDVQPKPPRTEEPVCSTARVKEDSVNKGDAILNNIGKEISQDLQGARKQSADAQKHSRRRAEAPAVTYATYRGSARIRQLLRGQEETAGKGEQRPEDRNTSTVRENGEIQRAPSLESGHLTEENGREEGTDHEDDALINPAVVRRGSTQCGKAQQCLDRSKRGATGKATAPSTGSCHELHLRHTPALAQVTRTHSLDSFLSFGSRNVEILTNSTSQLSPSLRVSSANDLVGKEDGLRGGGGAALVQPNKNAILDLDKENGCSQAANKEDCLHSPQSKSKAGNGELQVSKGQLCCTYQMDNHSEQTLGGQMTHFSTTASQQQAEQQAGCASRDGHPRKNGPQNIGAAVEREQNPQNFPAAVLLPFNEQVSPSLGMDCRGGECMATGALTASVGMSGTPGPVHNGHELIHVESPEGATTEQGGLPSLRTEGVEAMKVLSEAAVDNIASVSPCIQGCHHPSPKFRNKALGKREDSLKDARETFSHPDLEYEKSKSLEPVDMSLSKHSVPVHNHSPVSLEDIPAKTEDNSAPCPVITTDDHTPAASKPDKTGITGAHLVPSECEGCTSELASHVSKSQETNLPVSHSAMRCEGRPLTNNSAFPWEEGAVGIISGSPPVSANRCSSFSSKKENSNKPRKSPTVLDCSSGNPGKMLPSPTSSASGQIAASDQDSCVFAAAESGRITPEDRRQEGSPCLGDPRALCPAEISPPVLDDCADGVSGGGVCLPRHTSPARGCREASSLSVSTLEMLGTAQGSTSSPSHRATDGQGEHADVKGQGQATFQDAAVLFKKAEEIVDLVLHLATEEIIAKQAFDVCQPCGSKDSLVNRGILNCQKAGTVQLEGEEIQSAVQSLKDFNESSGGGSSSFTGNERVGTNNQDEKILSCIPDKIDLDSALALKAKETVEEVINSAIQKLASSQWPGTESKRPSGKAESKPKAEMPKTLNLDGKSPAETQGPAEMKETQGVSVNCEKAHCSAPLLPNSMANGIDWPQRDERGPKNAIACQTNGDFPSGSLASPESDLLTPAEERHSRTGCDHLAAAEMGGKAGVPAVSRKSEGPLHFVYRETAVSEEMLLSLQLEGSCNSTDMPGCTSLPTAQLGLSPFVPEEAPVGMQSESKDKGSPQVSLGSSAEDSPHEHCRGAPAQVTVTLGDAKAVESKGELAEGASEREEGSSGLHTQFTVPALSLPGEDSEGEQCFSTVFAQNKENLKQAARKDQGVETNDQLIKNGLDCSGDMKESAELLASSPLMEQLENGSFSIIYEGALQTENRSVSADAMQTGSAPSAGLPLGDTAHPRCGRAGDEQGSACLCVQEQGLKEAADGRGSGSFLSVEAKRYRVYPFSLSPIYEDDSSQEELLSTDVSPESRAGGGARDSSDHAAVLSLLQSVSERLQFTARFSEEEDGVEEEEEESSYEENTLDVEKEDDCLPSQWRGDLKTSLQLNDQNRSLLPEQAFLLSKEQLDSQEQPEQFPDAASPPQTPRKSVPEKAGVAPTHPPTSVYYQYLKSASSASAEKGPRFRSLLQDVLQPKMPWAQDHAVPTLAELAENLIDRASLKYNPRPGKIIIYDTYGSKSKQEVHSDVLDTSSWTFPVGALLRIVRGCWIFYEKPKFQGRKYVLEEGEAVLDHLWDLPGVKHHGRNLSVGSIKHVTKDCGIPELEFCLAAGSTQGPPICIQGAIPNLEELDVERNPYLRVKSGVWLAYSDLNYKGEVTVLEDCDSPPEIPSADVRSLRPLRMGGLKVQMPMNVKIIIYEKTHFGGWCKEFSENIPSVPALFAREEEFQGIGSIRVIGGVWVAYTKERYKGQQYLLEEGDYEDRHCWGAAASGLLSFRFLQADFIESSVALFQSDDKDGKALDISNEEIPDLEKAGFGPETRSILVRSGVWVAYQQKYFCGEQYVLEKGKYKCFLDWGGSSKIIMSIRPVKLEPLGMNEPPHLLKAFSNTHFQGACIDFTAEVSDFTSFIPCSFKVLRGCWLLYYQGEVSDNHCVLEEGLYADLSSCGCPTATIKSLKPIQYVFAEPSISLFTLEGCKGRELHFSEPVNSVLNEDLHFYTQAVWVRSGLWIAYEGCNFLGRQILLEPGEIPNWNEHSGWKAIGSLRPVKQPAVYVRLRNRAQGRYLTVAGSLPDVRAASVCASPDSGSSTQHWHYCHGLFKARANNACLDVIGGRDVPGAKVALWAQHGKDRQKWRLNEDGTISSYLSEQLVLDIKGGNYYDKNHIIMNQPIEGRLSQKWDIEIL